MVGSLSLSLVALFLYARSGLSSQRSHESQPGRAAFCKSLCVRATDHNGQLYVYPIKSLRGTTVTEGTLTPLGLQYDRCFMLLKVEPVENGSGTTLKNMHVPHFPEIALFQTAIELPETEEDSGKIIVTYHPPSSSTADEKESCKPKRLEIPLRPSVKQVKKLKKLNVTMHRSPTTGYDMGADYNDWFSARFGYPVVLAYLGTNTRGVLGTLAPRKRNNERFWTIWWKEYIQGPKGKEKSLIYLAWIYAVVGIIYKTYDSTQSGRSSTGAMGAMVLSLTLFLIVLHWSTLRRREDRITFADCAPYLVISETSVDNVSARLSDGEEMDRTKFRPNIVISGAETAFEEDFWTELGIGSHGARLLLTGNCVRCQSLNVDFRTGKMGTGEAGRVLKKLMKDRRVDRGARFSPVFGRYSFLDREAAGEAIRVGDEVEVLARGEERTVTGKLILFSLWTCVFC